MTVGKCPKILNTLFHTFLPFFFLFMQLLHKIYSQMANSVDPASFQILQSITIPIHITLSLVQPVFALLPNTEREA